MRSINKVIIIGNLTRNPETRQTPNGQNVTTFGIATNREWVTRDGERRTSAEFHECVAWAHLAEICQKYIKKGNLVYIEGYLKTRNWETPEGLKKFKTEIVVQDLIMLEKRPRDHSNFKEMEESKSETDTDTKSESKTESVEEGSKEIPEESASETSEEKKELVTSAASSSEPEEASLGSSLGESPIDKDLGL